MNRIEIRWHRRSLLVIIIAIIILNFNLFSSDVFNIRIFDHKEKNIFTRIVFESTVPFAYSTDSANPDNFVIVNQNLKRFSFNTRNMSDKIKNINFKFLRGKSIFSIDSDYEFYIWRKFTLDKPFRFVVDLKERGKKRIESKKNIHENKKAQKRIVFEKKRINIKKVEKKKNVFEKKQNTNENNKSSVAKNKLKKNEKNKVLTICIDPGHGGDNYGAIGRYLKEKDITLSISKILKKLIVDKLKLKVIMIRNGDYDVSLNKRAEIANKNNADIFISIHINSSAKKGAKGPETFFVSLKATDKDAFELAKKENMSYKEIEKKVEIEALKKILWDMAQTDYIRHSSKLADFIQRELNILMHTRNRGVKQAPFRVLMRASMPAVLVEIGFISDREEEKLLMSNDFRKKAALAVFKGLKRYIKR